MFRAHPPASSARHAPVPTTAASRPRRKAEHRPKRSRSPCEDEVRFKELQKQKTEAQNRTRQQLGVLSSLEANILDFYYTHTIHYEQLMQPSTSTVTHGDGDSDTPAAANAASLSRDLLAVFPDLKVPSSPSASSSDAADNKASGDAVPLTVPSKTRYYYDSALMRLYREVAMQERDLAQHYASEEALVRSTETEVQTEIIDGALATQMRAERAARDALAALEATLTKLRSQCSAHTAAIEAAETRIASTDKAVEACEKRKAVLEAKKQEQMDNAEKIKDEVAAFRRTVEAAAQDVEKRTAINKSLEDEIARRKAILRRKKKD